LEVLSLEAGGVRVIDTLNFLPMPLSAFPKTFGITELKKGHFPHFFNTTENWNYEGPLPDLEFYGPEALKEDAQAELVGTKKKGQRMPHSICKRSSKNTASRMSTSSQREL